MEGELKTFVFYYNVELYLDFIKYSGIYFFINNKKYLKCKPTNWDGIIRLNMKSIKKYIFYCSN